MQVDEIARAVEGVAVVEMDERRFRHIYDSIKLMDMAELNQLDDKLAIGAEEDVRSEVDPGSVTLATMMAVYDRKADLVVEEIKQPDANPYKLIEFIKSSYRRMWLLPSLAHRLDEEISRIEKDGMDTIAADVGVLVSLHGVAGYVYASIALRHWLY